VAKETAVFLSTTTAMRVEIFLLRITSILEKRLSEEKDVSKTHRTKRSFTKVGSTRIMGRTVGDEAHSKTILIRILVTSHHIEDIRVIKMEQLAA
jgi:hypothetical protein